jgi:hypothetical protein
MNTAAVKAMDTKDLINLQSALSAKYIAGERFDIKLLRKVDAELDARFN